MTTDRANLRKRAGYTLRQLSRDSGVSTSVLSSWERGEMTLSQEKVRRVGCAIYYASKETPRFTNLEEVILLLEKEGT